MKQIFRLIMLFLAGAFTISAAIGQANASLGIVTQNSGNVVVGQTGFLQANVKNTGPTSSIPAYTIKLEIAVPPTVTISSALSQLPTGWTILDNDGALMTLSNGTDVIPVNGDRQILIALVGGASPAPASTVSGGLSFADGMPPGDGFGDLNGNNTTDDISTSSVAVIAAPACAISVSASAGIISCNGGTTTLTATASGTTNAVQYSLNGGAFQAGNTFTVNAAGSPYTVTAREVATITCTANSTPLTVTQPTAISASAAVSTPIAVAGGTGAITVSASGGTGTKTYVITTGATTNTTGATSGVFTGLLAGNYTFTATDANSCTKTTSSVALNNPAACNIAVSASAGTIACNGGTTTLTATATGASGALEYKLNSGAFQSSNTFTVNAAGSPYTVTAREVGNTTCSATASPVTVIQPSAVLASAVITTPIA
ncbi:MAG: hypothetical protein ABIO55_05250, partial [Ginsengibacter sp.]